MSAPRRRVGKFAPLLLSGAATLAACGARGPLDIIIVEEGVDAGEDGATNLDDGTAPDGSGTDAGPGGDTGAPDAPSADALADAAPEASLVNCGQCVVQNCGGELIQCLGSATCRATLQCSVQMCLATGTPDPQCVLGCANGDQQSLSQLIGIFGCVIGNCGTQCATVLGGLGGIGLGGGSSGGGF